MREARARKRAKRARVFFAKLVVVGIGVLASICACDVRHDENAILDECREYVEIVSSCLGGSTASRMTVAYSAPPTDPAARASMRGRCGAHRDRMRDVCR